MQNPPCISTEQTYVRNRITLGKWLNAVDTIHSATVDWNFYLRKERKLVCKTREESKINKYSAAIILFILV